MPYNKQKECSEILKMIPHKTSSFADKIENGETVGITFYYYNKANNSFVSSLVKKVLERRNLNFLQDTVMTILREIIVNAVKANSKRLYFLSNNWDISNTEQYLKGMENFKNYIITNGENISGNLKENNLKVEIYFKKENAGFKIFVRNDTPILPGELERIKFRMDNAKKYNDFTEVYDEISDVSEGEGLGLTLSMLFLRNSGIGEQSLQIGSNGKITQATLTIPSVLHPKTITSRIQDKIISEVDSLPALPEHITKIMDLCSDTEAPIKAIADRISTDPSLSASVLKLANSASFIIRNKADSITDAIKVIGIKNLTALLSASSAKSAMDKRFNSYRNIWEHCNKVAFYAHCIAEKKKLTKISDKVFLAGMLHDLGKIVLLTVSPTIDEWLADFAIKREIRTSTIIEEISIGISHTIIGGLISQKWNMPDYVTDAIKYHHSPSLYTGEDKKIISIVYLADEMCDIEEGRSAYTFLESEILEMFGLEDEAEFTAFHDQIKAIPFEPVI